MTDNIKKKLLEKYGEDGIFDAFTNYLDIPPSATGKNIHT